jgi:N,N'-diacetyllegionaminate synthase
MKFNRTIGIGNKEISDESAVFIIAEAGVNHNGDLNIAKKLIDIAVDSGVDAVKFQAFKTESLILSEVTKAEYQQKTTNNNESQFEMLKKLEINKEQNSELLEYCKRKGIIFLTTPFDDDSLSELEMIGLSAYKIASTDTTNLPFLRKIAKTGKPIILSTGMSYLSEIQLALKEIYEINKNVILLQCTANYPIKDNEANLNVLMTYKEMFNLLVGYSDHSVGIGASPYAVPLGAKIVEKHFTLNKQDDGPDHRASLSPDELKQYVQEVRKVEKYLGSSIKSPSFDEVQTRKSLQKCLVASKRIEEGELFSLSNIVAKRTGGIGISPIYYRTIIGKPSKKIFEKEEIISA